MRIGEGAAKATVNNELAIIVRAFSLGIKHEKISTKPHISKLDPNNVRQGFFDHAQLQEIEKYLLPQNRGPAKFAYITGWRKQEVLRLTWPTVDFEAGMIRLEPGATKNKEGRQFPITDELKPILETQRAKADALKRHSIITPYVFFNERPGKRLGHRIGDPKRNWNSACRKAGYPAKLFHDFRRTAVRTFEQAGVSRSVSMQLTGHKTESVYRRYAIVCESDLTAAGERLNAFSASATTKDTAKDAPKTTEFPATAVEG